MDTGTLETGTLDRGDLGTGDLVTDAVSGDVPGEDSAWTDQAACKGRIDLFFGIAGERPERRVRREAIARRLCESCAVLATCRATARRNRENGFWGGESEEERAAAGYPPRSISRRAVQAAAAEAS